MKSYYGGPIESHKRSFERHHPDTCGLPFPKIGGSQPQRKTAIAIISETGKATNFKYGGYINRVCPNKSPWKIWEKRERGRIHGLSKFIEYPLLSQERVKMSHSQHQSWSPKHHNNAEGVGVTKGRVLWLWYSYSVWMAGRRQPSFVSENMTVNTSVDEQNLQ